MFKCENANGSLIDLSFASNSEYKALQRNAYTSVHSHTVYIFLYVLGLPFHLSFCFCFSFFCWFALPNSCTDSLYSEDLVHVHRTPRSELLARYFSLLLARSSICQLSRAQHNNSSLCRRFASLEAVVKFKAVFISFLDPSCI